MLETVSSFRHGQSHMMSSSRHHGIIIYYYKIKESKQVMRKFWLSINFLYWKSLFSLHQNCRKLLLYAFKKIPVLSWSIDMLLDTQEVTIWQHGNLIHQLKKSRIQKNHEMFLSIRQVFDFKRYVFLSQKLVQNVSNTHKLFCTVLSGVWTCF